MTILHMKIKQLSRGQYQELSIYQNHLLYKAKNIQSLPISQNANLNWYKEADLISAKDMTMATL